MTKKEIFDLCLEQQNRMLRSELSFRKKFPEEYKDLCSWEFPKNYSFCQKLWHYLQDDRNLELGKCKRCGKPCGFKRFNTGYFTYCTSKCANGSKEHLENHKKTCLKKYGVDNPSKVKSIQKKKRNTFKTKYGVDNPSQCKEFQDKKKATCIDRYGVEYHSQSKHHKESVNETWKNKTPEELALKTKRQKETCLKLYGNENYHNYEQAKKTNLEKYGAENTWCLANKNLNPQIKDSKPNLEFAELLDKNNISYEREYRIGHYFYDFKVNDFLIEINPTITHNSRLNIYGGDALDKNYHYDKTNVAKCNGFVCICVWDWTNKNKIIDVLKSGKVDILEHEPVKHWHNIKTNEHFVDNGQSDDDMFIEGFLPVYDDGISINI